MDIQKTCCFCNQTFTGYGNNPAPLADSDQCCCDACNLRYVIPARLVKAAEMYRKADKPS